MYSDVFDGSYLGQTIGAHFVKVVWYGGVTVISFGGKQIDISPSSWSLTSLLYSLLPSLPSSLVLSLYKCSLCAHPCHCTWHLAISPLPAAIWNDSHHFRRIPIISIVKKLQAFTSLYLLPCCFVNLTLLFYHCQFVHSPALLPPICSVCHNILYTSQISTFCTRSSFLH